MGILPLGDPIMNLNNVLYNDISVQLPYFSTDTNGESRESINRAVSRFGEIHMSPLRTVTVFIEANRLSRNKQTQEQLWKACLHDFPL